MSYDVIISNSKLNSYGFRVLTSGINFIQFLKNPIMLFMHNRPTGWRKDDIILPIGTIENLRLEGDDLKGTLKFDEVDEFSKKIKAKWDAGTLKMVSAGLEPISRTDDPAYLLPGQRYETITECKLVEVSVVDIGANDDALALYDEGKIITLSTGNENDFLKPIINKNEHKMKAIALKLGLPETATEADILEKIGTITLAASKVATLEAEAQTQREAAIAAEVDNAITLKKVTADKREHFISLGKTAGIESLKITLSMMATTPKPTDLLHLGKDSKDADIVKLSQLNAQQIEDMRANDRETYVKLFKAEYGFEPGF